MNADMSPDPAQEPDGKSLDNSGSDIRNIPRSSRDIERHGLTQALARIISCARPTSRNSAEPVLY
jgi:hypothetical protein